MTPEQAERRQLIARRLASGATHAQIAAEFGVSKQRVHQIASDLPKPCRCGCGETIPPGTPGHRCYLSGHEPADDPCRCGAVKSAHATECEDCFLARKTREADLTGLVFGDWVVLGLVYPSWTGRTGSHPLWWCRCRCGRVKGVWAQNLTRGLSGGCADCGYKRRSARWAAERAARAECG